MAWSEELKDLIPAIYYILALKVNEFHVSNLLCVLCSTDMKLLFVHRQRFIIGKAIGESPSHTHRLVCELETTGVTNTFTEARYNVYIFVKQTKKSQAFQRPRDT